MSIAIPEAITTLAEAERRFNLLRSQAKTFFSAWQTDLPTLSPSEQTALDDAPLTSNRKLYNALQILKRIGQEIR